MRADHSHLVKVEQQIVGHEQSVTSLSQSLEEWLSGRVAQKAFLERLDVVKKGLSPYQGLDRSTGSRLSSEEQGLVAAVLEFARTENPSASGQKELFLTLARLTEERNQILLDWRKKELTSTLAGEKSLKRRSYYAWESAWIPLWQEEARLTYQLQRSVLAPKEGDGGGKSVLSGLLKLNSEAQQIKVPESAAALHKLSTDRLTVLARTGEQLLRLEQRQSRSAVTQIRRLSSKLSELTGEYQKKRLELLKSL